MYTKKKLSEYDYISIDVETYGLKWWLPEEGIFGIALSTCEGEHIYYDIRETPEFVDWLQVQEPKKIVNHNIKFDLHMLWAIGVMFKPEICECTMVRATLIDGNLFQYSLDALAKKYLNAEKDNGVYEELSKLYKGKSTRDTQIKNLYKAPYELVSKYAKKDTELALKLWELQEKLIPENDLLKIWKLEKELLPVIFEMERGGIRVDVKRAEKAVIEVSKLIDKDQSELDKLVGFKVNVNSNKDLSKVFNPVLKHTQWFTSEGDPLESTSKGNVSFSKGSIKECVGKKATLILSIRENLKTRDTFLKGHILGFAHEQYVHSNINQTKGEIGGAVTGRLSMSQPAMQQIPARNKKTAKILRPIFMPDQGHIWACWDYDQFEYRVFSHYVDDPRILKVYRDNPKFDYHQMVSDLTGLPRNAPETGGPNAKQLNLSMIYDMGNASIARNLGLPIEEEPGTFISKEDGRTITYFKAGEEALEIIEKYHKAIPGVRQFKKQVQATIEKREFKSKKGGYVTSLGGRKLYFPKASEKNKAKARLCQGSSADCMKVKLIEVHKYFKDHAPECRILLCVHDELNVSIPKDIPNLRKVLKDITRILENYDGVTTPIKLKIPIRTDFGIGYTWADASGKGA
jgi:DNA polymerase I-like protein with 3'-5' exonuclease and polymerase domains